MDFRKTLLEGYRKTIPQELQKMWDQLGCVLPHLSLPERADWLKDDLDAQVQRRAEQRRQGGDIEFGIIVPGIVQTLVEEFLALKLKEEANGE